LPGRNRAAIRQLHIAGNRAKIKASKRADHNKREFATMKIFLIVEPATRKAGR
jgi:hypothetical protein